MPSLDDILHVLLLRDYNTRLVVISTAVLGLASGLIGSFLLLRKRSLMGDALSHATLPGVALAFIVLVMSGGSGKNLPVLLIGAALTGVLGVVAVLLIDRATRLRDDATMGIVLSVFFGVGVALLGMIQSMPQGSAAGLESFIYGKTASMIMQDFVIIAGVAAAVAVGCGLLFKEFALVCFDDGFAASQGWPVGLIDVVMLALIAAVTVVGLQAVGLILIIAFLITPPAAARFWTNDLRAMALSAGAIGGISGWLGASISALTPDAPAGAVIVLVAAAVFVVSLFVGPARGVLVQAMARWRLRQAMGRQHLLRAAYELLEASDGRLEPRPIRIGELLAKRSWSRRRLMRLIDRAEGEGLVIEQPPDALRLTERGQREAARVTRNHRLWEMYLVMHADIAPSHVDRDADMVEHVLGTEMVEKLETALRVRRSESGGSRVPQSPHQIAEDR